MGQILGGAIAVWLLGLLCGLAFKSKEPGERALFAALTAWVLAGVLAGFGMADGGPFRFDAILLYLPGAILAYFLLKRRYDGEWVDDE